MAGRLEPVSESMTPNMDMPIAPPKRSKTPKKPNISPALCRGISTAKSDRDRAWTPPITIATAKAKKKNWPIVWRL